MVAVVWISTSFDLGSMVLSCGWMSGGSVNLHGEKKLQLYFH